MMGRSLMLENFDAVPDEEVPAIDELSEDYLDGHAAGYAAGLEAARAAQDHLSAEVVQKLADMSFGYSEARAHLLASLQPLFRVVIAAVLPRLTAAALAPHLLEMLAEAALTDSALPVEITVHPEAAIALAPLIERAGTMPVMLVPDASLEPDFAILRSGTRETALDLAQIEARMADILSAVFDEPQRMTKHG